MLLIVRIHVLADCEGPARVLTISRHFKGLQLEQFVILRFGELDGIFHYGLGSTRRDRNFKAKIAKIVRVDPPEEIKLSNPREDI